MTGPTTTTSLNDFVYTTLLEADYQEALVPHRIFRPFLRHAPKMPGSLAYTFNTIDDIGTAGVQTSITEATTDLVTAGYQVVASTGTAATADDRGIISLVGDVVVDVSIAEVSPIVSTALAKATGEKYDLEAMAVIDNFANTTGGATPLTLARILLAVATLEQRDVGSTGENLMMGTAPKAVGDLKQDMATSTAAWYGNSNAPSLVGASLSGYVGEPVGGVPLYQSSSVSSASGSYNGFILAVGQAVGVHERWIDRLRTQRDESLLGEEVVVSGVYGFALIDDNRLQGVLSST